MTEEVAAKVEVFVADPMFDPVAMLRVSQAAATICKWVKAMDAFQKGRKVSRYQRDWPLPACSPRALRCKGWPGIQGTVR